MSNHEISPLAASAGLAGGPLYRQVKQAVLDALARGEWKQGQAIPPEKVLAQRFAVSIGTLRKAIDELQAEQILVRHQGRGTFVAVHTRNEHFFRYFRIVRQDGQQAYPVTRVLRFRRVRASALVREKLALPAGSTVFQFHNLQVLSGDAVMIDEIHVPEALFPGLTERRLQERTSTMYSLYQDAFGINVIATDEFARATLADAQYAQWLGVAEGEPLLELRRVAYSYNRQPVEWRVSRVDTRHYEYVGQRASRDA